MAINTHAWLGRPGLDAIRQRRETSKWESYMANVAAKKLQQSQRLYATR